MDTPPDGGRPRDLIDEACAHLVMALPEPRRAGPAGIVEPIAEVL